MEAPVRYVYAPTPSIHVAVVDFVRFSHARRTHLNRTEAAGLSILSAVPVHARMHAYIQYVPACCTRVGDAG